ncbi:MAG: amidohydrolase family protein [Rhodospirillales bacterium]|nr:amidohydrolase family protein [Rhodospirillales bacterium]
MIASGGIDGCVFLGRDQATGFDVGTDALLDGLVAMGADRVVAVSSAAIRYDWREANARLTALAREDMRIVPAAAIPLPAYDAGEGIVTRLRAENFAAVAVVSDAMGWSLQGPALDALARECAVGGMPLLLCAATGPDLSAAERAAAAGGTVLLRWTRAHGYFRLADLIATAYRHPNVLVDIGSQSQTGTIEHLVARLGPERLFVSSGAPAAHAGCAWFMLAAADLDATARAQIAGGNLTRTLGLSSTGGFRVPVAYRALVDSPKTDTHWHTGRWNLIETRTDVSDLQILAERAGVSVFVSSSIRALSDDLEAGNAETAALLAADPRARGLIVINPLRPEASLAEIARYRNDRRFVGVKTIQDFYGLELDAPQYDAIFGKLDAGDELSVMAHLPGMARAARRHPHLKFVAAHATWRFNDLIELPNVWFDIATSSPRVVESDIARLVATAGAKRVVFSSDAPLIDPAWTLGKLASGGLAQADIVQILGPSARGAFARLGDGR